jgi:hypothetical protein
METKQKPIGIQPLFTALVYEATCGTADETRDIYQADSPSIYAEARLGAASQREIAEQLSKVIADVRKDIVNAPYLEKWLQEKKNLSISDLESTAAKVNKSAAIIREEALEHATHSDLGTLTARVKARKTGVAADTLKYWDVEMSNYRLVNDGFDLNPSFRRDCQCGFKGKHTNKRKLWDENIEKERNFLEEMVDRGLASHKELGRELHVSCYHEAVLATAMELQNNRGREKRIAGLQEPTTIAFDLIDRWDLVFEAYARRYKFKQLYGETDEFLFEHDIITPYFKPLIIEGKVNKEVIKKSRHFEPVQKDIIMNVHRMMAENGFKHRGFCNEFKGIKNSKKDYETIGMVFENPTRDTSYTVVYDKTFWMPYIVRKNFVHFGREPRHQLHQRNPARMAYGFGREKIYQLDDRTQRIAEVTVIQPEQLIEDIAGAKAKYERYRQSLK